MLDADHDGSITSEELIKVIEKVGGCMSSDEARGLIRKADMDKNGAIDFTEFNTLWTSLKGGDDVRIIVNKTTGLRSCERYLTNI